MELIQYKPYHILTYFRSNEWYYTVTDLQTSRYRHDKYGRLLEIIAAKKAEDLETRQFNIQAQKHNHEIRNDIIQQMEDLGFKRTERTDINPQTNRKSRITLYTVDQKWLKGIISAFAGLWSSDNHWRFTQFEHNLNEAYEQVLKELNRKEEKWQEENVPKKSDPYTREKIIKVYEIAKKYDIDTDLETHDVLYELIDQDSNLNVAHWLYRNREDWSEGSSYAETALDCFNPQSDEEKELYAEIQEAIENFELDGRIFGRLSSPFFEKVDKGLVQDYWELKNLL